VPVVDVGAARLIRSLPWFETDDGAIGHLAAEHLLERGFRQFAFAGERVIAADATISNGLNENDRTRNRYTGIRGGWSKLHDTPHMVGKMPTGGNLLFLDSHAEFRKFPKMNVRTDGDPTFWW